MDATVKSGLDTWAGSGRPSLEHGSDSRLNLQTSAGTTSYGFLYLKSPAPRGATIISATLTVHAAGASNGARTLTVQRVSSSWKASKLNYNNRPGVMGGPKPTAAVNVLHDGDAISFDVTAHVQSIANGSAHYGWRIETNATAVHKLMSCDAATNRPTLSVTWSDQPDAPTTLSPSSSAVSVDKPVLRFDYTDVSGSTDLVAVRVQIDPAANADAPAFDSGEVASTVPELDLTQTTYAGLADGASTSWRCSVKDGAGLWSEWSDWATFSRDDLGAVTITNPAAAPNDFVSEPTPPIMWTFAGETQVAWQVRILDGTDATAILYDSGKRNGTDTSHTLPPKILHDAATYVAVVRAWDAKQREATPGHPVYAEASRAFTMNNDPTVDAPTGLVAVEDGETPSVVLTWSRATAPDSFAILRDGKIIDADAEPAEVFDSGTSYRYVDVGAAPQILHTYAVRAVVNGKQSPNSAAATIITQPEGLWIIDNARGLSFKVSGTGVDDWRMTDQVTTWQPIGAQRPVQATIAQQGLSGTFTGIMVGAAGRTLADFESDLLAIKGHPDATVQLVADYLSIPVTLSGLSVSPHPDSFLGDPKRIVGFRFAQVDDFAFDSRI